MSEYSPWKRGLYSAALVASLGASAASCETPGGSDGEQGLSASSITAGHFKQNANIRTQHSTDETGANVCDVLRANFSFGSQAIQFYVNPLGDANGPWAGFDASKLGGEIQDNCGNTIIWVSESQIVADK